MINEFSLSKIQKYRSMCDTGSISTYVAEGKDKTTRREAREKLNILIHELKKRGFVSIKTVGYYQGGQEQSLFVADPKQQGNLKETLIEFGKIFNQDTILFRPKGGKSKLIVTKGKKFGNESPDSHTTSYGSSTTANYSKVGGRTFSDTIDIPDEFWPEDEERLMKKNNIFRHELNDSVQAKATLNCLTNRNKKHLKESIGEVYPDSRWGEKERLNGPNGMSKTERDVLIKLEQIMPNLVQKAMSKAADHNNPDEIKKLVLSMIMQGNLMQKLGDKIGASWKEFSMGFKREIINLVKNEFDKHEEQEETTTPPWIGRQYNGGIDFDADGNLQVITPDDDDDDDDYEAPPLFKSEQERHDIALACSYCLGESFIDNDGDLDDIYYAVLNVFDSTYDAPPSDDYKEVLQWCRRYYQEIEQSLMNQ